MPTDADAITRLINAYTSLKEWFEGARADIEDRLGAVASRYVGTTSIVHVDQARGNDDFPGTRDEPVKTIQRAIDLCPIYAIADIRVRGDYTTTRRYYADGRKINIVGYLDHPTEWTRASATNHPRMTISMGSTLLSSGINQAEVYGFETGQSSYLRLSHFGIHLPSADQIIPGTDTSNRSSLAAFAPRLSANGAPDAVILTYLDLHVPDDPAGTLLGPQIGGRCLFFVVTVTGSLSGHVHPLASAGQTPAEVPHILLTNIATL